MDDKSAVIAAKKFLDREGSRLRGEPVHRKSAAALGRIELLLSGAEHSGRDKKTRQWGHRASNSTQNDLGFRQLCRLRGLLFDHAFCLRTFLPLDNFEFDVIALLKALITL